MKIVSTDQPVAKIAAEAVVVGIYTDRALEGPAAALDEATDGLLSRLRASEEVSDKRCSTTSLLAAPGIAAGQVICVGFGHREDFDPTAAFQCAAAAAKHLSSKQRGTVAFYGDPRWPDSMTQAAVAGSAVGCRGQDLYQKEKTRYPFEQLLWSTTKDTIATGRILAESINLTRRLVDEPPGKLYPAAFAEAAREVARQYELKIDVWGIEKLKAERCGALLAVAQGSSQEPQLVILRYRGGQADDPVLALVGKGVTFDSGGLSLKPSESMMTMKCDMAGAATVLGAVNAIAALKLPVNVTGYLGLVENMTGPSAYKLGDVLTARDGTTIEIHNTDAEGRLVLADTLAVAVDQGADKIIDLATLTGACVVALGEQVAGVMSNDQDWCDRILEAAESSGEAAWQLPMFDEYAAQIKSKIADIKNTGDGRWGGAITAAKLLERFVGDVPWTHIDIAGPAFAEKPQPWLDGGGTGVMVRTLVEVARHWPDQHPADEPAAEKSPRG
ncbi:MAG: leucyl aminopeptidase [Planctomycetales bacterium]|nr:leucyl aminopeptidase [Planctomycetales bacterium]